jgi:hypothetical protein
LTERTLRSLRSPLQPCYTWVGPATIRTSRRVVLGGEPGEVFSLLAWKQLGGEGPALAGGRGGLTGQVGVAPPKAVRRARSGLFIGERRLR